MGYVAGVLLRTIGQGFVGGENAGAVEAAFRAFAAVTEPEAEKLVYHFLNMNHGDSRKGTTSVKPGSIVLNRRRLFESGPGVVLAGGGATAGPWMMAFSALAIWNEVVKQATITIEPLDSVVLEASWQARDGRYRVSRQAGFDSGSKLFAEYKMPPIDPHAFEKSIDTLDGLRCIEVAGDEIWLREWFKKSFYE